MVTAAQIASVIVVLEACSANDDFHDPAVAAVTPERATPGTMVVVTGSYFCYQPEAEEGEEVDPLACDQVGDVLFDSVPGNSGPYMDSSIVVEVPPVVPGVARLIVVVGSRASNGIEFTVE